MNNCRNRINSSKVIRPFLRIIESNKFYAQTIAFKKTLKRRCMWAIPTPAQYQYKPNEKFIALFNHMLVDYFHEFLLSNLVFHKCSTKLYTPNRSVLYLFRP
ncbi:hypothetical protein PAEPH01_1214 [Pancytospora epiphaga]|nr:hypothetical protein PAEPH01_1214 [Pancytospora epiphaga]